MKTYVVPCILAILLLVGVSSISAEQQPEVLLLMPSLGVMGAEFFAVLERFEELGISAEVAAGEAGPYQFWEDSTECRDSEALGGYEFNVILTIGEAQLEDYDAVVVAPGWAHSFWVEPGADCAIALLHEAASRGMPIGGMSYGVWVLLWSGILDGRTACSWPHPQGVLSPELHWSGFLSTLDVEFLPGCVTTDHGTAGQSPIVTANYRCPAGFAEAVAEVLLTTNTQ